ncbi:MAG: hypothetical protein OEZ22_02680 [Spirochaetia bacterium]|nr:hypothetical protein [Spirochaetia bacterium]
MKKKIIKYILYLVLTIIVSSCKKSTQVPVCEPESGLFIDGKHYISSEFLTENYTWDYKQLEKYYRNKSGSIPSYNCIPIKRDKSLAEILTEKEEFVDLMK